jgi:hypothetical protein
MGTLAVELDATTVDVTLDAELLHVMSADGRAVALPLAWFPRCGLLRRCSVEFDVSSDADRVSIGPVWMKIFRWRGCCESVKA